MKYLGLDIGQKFVGAAIGSVIAEELTTINAPKDINFYSEDGKLYLSGQLAKIISENRVDALVAGLPVNDDGQHTSESVKIEAVISFLENQLDLPIFRLDETLTTFMARDILASQGLKQSEIDNRIHQTCAQLILQQYLEEHALA